MNNNPYKNGKYIFREEVIQMKPDKDMTAVEMAVVKDAIGIILSDVPKFTTSLNYAVNYCKYAMGIEDPEEMEVQVLYILNNIRGWRHPKAKLVRSTLESFAKMRR